MAVRGPDGRRHSHTWERGRRAGRPSRSPRAGPQALCCCCPVPEALGSWECHMRCCVPESKGEVEGQRAEKEQRGRRGSSGADVGKEGRARPGWTTVRTIPLLFHCCNYKRSRILKQRWAVREHSGEGCDRRPQQVVPEKSAAHFCHLAEIEPSAMMPPRSS